MQAGESLEIEVKEMIESELKRGTLGINADAAKVFHRKGYWSGARGAKIVTDVSIEVFRHGAEKPFLIWVWECKDYKKPVPVDDIEEFHSKLEQIGIHRTKGTVACRNGFQKSALKVAASYGIGLARILPSPSYIMLMEAVRVVTRELAVFGLTQPDTERLESMFYGMSTSGEAAREMSDLISSELSSE